MVTSNFGLTAKNNNS